jgi:hypothetical protein
VVSLSELAEDQPPSQENSALDSQRTETSLTEQFSDAVGSTTLPGGWDLFVMDTGGGNRGVIAEGWSIDYQQEFGGPSSRGPEQARA